jgi:hypothetical protein
MFERGREISGLETYYVDFDRMAGNEQTGALNLTGQRAKGV